jgi:hypothetical protein
MARRMLLKDEEIRQLRERLMLDQYYPRLMDIYSRILQPRAILVTESLSVGEVLDRLE